MQNSNKPIDYYVVSYENDVYDIMCKDREKLFCRISFYDEEISMQNLMHVLAEVVKDQRGDRERETEA